MKKKTGKRTTRGVRSLSSKPLTEKRASRVKGGGAIKMPGMNKSSDITLKRG